MPPMNGTGQYRALPKGTGQYRAIPQGTGEYRPIPQRPPGMRHLDTPPPTQKVERPKRKAVTKQALQRRLLILSAVIAVCGVLAWILGSSIYNYVNATTMTSGAATTAVDFLNALNTQNYDQAYKDLGPTITLRLTPDAFKQQAQSYDHCFGPVQNYKEVPNSAVIQDTSQSYTYSVTRSKSAQPFQLRLTLQQDPNGNGWRIADYGNSLGATQPSCR